MENTSPIKFINHLEESKFKTLPEYKIKAITKFDPEKYKININLQSIDGSTWEEIRKNRQKQIKKCLQDIQDLEYLLPISEIDKMTIRGYEGYISATLLYDIESFHFYYQKLKETVKNINRSIYFNFETEKQFIESQLLKKWYNGMDSSIQKRKNSL